MKKLFSVLYFVLFFFNGYSQNEYVQTKLNVTKPQKGMSPVVIGQYDDKFYVHYREKYFDHGGSLVAYDKELNPSKPVKINCPTNEKYADFKGVKVIGGKLAGLYLSYRPCRTLCVNQVFHQSYDVKTGQGGNTSLDLFKKDAINADNIDDAPSLIVSKTKLRSLVFTSNDMKEEVSLWIYDENMKEIYKKQLSITCQKDKYPVINDIKITDKGEVYFRYRCIEGKDNAVYYIAHVTPSGGFNTVKIPLIGGAWKVAPFMDLDNQDNPIVCYTRYSKLMLYDEYGIIKFDAGLNITGQNSIKISDDVVNAVKQYGPHHQGVVDLTPRNVFTKSDGTLILIAEQQLTSEQGDASYKSIVVFFLDKNLNQTSFFVLNKIQESRGVDFSSFGAFQKSDYIYLFYNSNFGGNLPKTDFNLRVILPDNKVTDEMVLKQKDKEEKMLQNVIPKPIRISYDELIFVTSGANSYSAGNTQDFCLLDVKLLK